MPPEIHRSSVSMVCSRDTERGPRRGCISEVDGYRGGIDTICRADCLIKWVPARQVRFPEAVLQERAVSRSTKADPIREAVGLDSTWRSVDVRRSPVCLGDVRRRGHY